MEQLTPAEDSFSVRENFNGSTGTWYVRSFEVVADSCRKNRIEYVREQLEAIKHILWRYDSSTLLNLKSVVLVISVAGIKMRSLDGKIDHMAHELKRVSYATCDPDFCIFAFVAREPRGELRNRQFCHVFKTDSPEQAEEINSAFGSAFRAAYVEKSRTTSLLQQRSPTENNFSPSSGAVIDVSINSNEQPQHLYEKSSGVNQTSSCLSTVAELPTKFKDQRVSVGYRRLSSAENLHIAKPEESFDEISPTHYAQLEKSDPPISVVSAEEFSQSPIVSVKMRAKPCTISDEKQQQRKRRPLSAAFMLLGGGSKKEKEKRKNGAPAATTAGFGQNQQNGTDLISQEDTAMWHATGSNASSSDVFDTVCSTSELIQKRNSCSSGVATTGGSIFRRLFGGSTWRVNNVNPNNVGQTDDNASCLRENHFSASSKKRRPLSAVFGGASLRGLNNLTGNNNGAGSDKKRNSILNLRSDSAIIVGPFQQQTGFKEPVDRRARSVMNLENVVRRGADSPARHSVVGATYLATCQQNSKSSNHALLRSSTDSSPNSTRDSLVPWPMDEEKKLQDAAWFVEKQPHKDVIKQVLSHEPVGSFVVRRSSSHSCCLALSVRVPVDHNIRGVSHFLILHTERGFKLKGFTKDFPSVHALVTHHSIMPEQLPCRLTFVNREQDVFLQQRSFANIKANADSTSNLDLVSKSTRTVGTCMIEEGVGGVGEEEEECIYGHLPLSSR